MRDDLLALDPALIGTTRLPTIAGGSRVRLIEIVALLLSGTAAAVLTHVVHFGLGIPGSNIVFVALPIALGFALVPRRGAGSIMAAGALGTTLAFWLTGVRLDGPGATTSLLLTGPLLDVALIRARAGWRLYLAFILACAVTNGVAFAVRGWTKVAALRGGGGGRGAGLGGGKPLDIWLPQAVWTYVLAGIVAGLISAAAWFHFRARRESLGQAPGDGT